MKTIMTVAGTALFALALSGQGQGQAGPGPHAWGDKDKDGKCDITGQPVGQGRGQGPRGMRRGAGCCGRQQANCGCQQGQGAAAGETKK